MFRQAQHERIKTNSPVRPEPVEGNEQKSIEPNHLPPQ